MVKVRTRAFNRVGYAAVLVVLTLLVAAFQQVTLKEAHGKGALVVLGLATILLVVAGGPRDRARTVRVSPTDIVIDRYTRITTRVTRAELADTRVDGHTLLLVPHDRNQFFAVHPELREVATADGAAVPIGRRTEVADELRAALAA